MSTPVGNNSQYPYVGIVKIDNSYRPIYCTDECAVFFITKHPASALDSAQRSATQCAAQKSLRVVTAPDDLANPIITISENNGTWSPILVTSQQIIPLSHKFGVLDEKGAIELAKKIVKETGKCNFIPPEILSLNDCEDWILSPTKKV